jgi:tripartite-type tricarboxylate transporter receptor subunit TctC
MTRCKLPIFLLSAPYTSGSWIVDQLNTEINAGLADAKLKTRLTELGSIPFAGSPSDFGKHLASETEKWAKVVRAANIKPE